MKNTIWILTLALAVLAPWRSARASSAVRLDLDQLADRSSRVVQAELLERHSAWDAAHRRILTTYRFAVTEDLAGRGEALLTVVQPGGTVGRWTQRTEGYPDFQVGETAVLFLGRPPAGLRPSDPRTRGYRIVGLCQGVFDPQRVGQRRMLFQRLEGLDFPGDAGQPLVVERAEAIRRVQARFRARIIP